MLSVVAADEFEILCFAAPFHGGWMRLAYCGYSRDNKYISIIHCIIFRSVRNIGLNTKTSKKVMNTTMSLLCGQQLKYQHKTSRNSLLCSLNTHVVANRLFSIPALGSTKFISGTFSLSLYQFVFNFCLIIPNNL